MDARPGPHIEHVGDALDLSRFPDGTFDTVVTKDMIEHLSWRDVPSALREWLRVLRPDGTLDIETPNADELFLLLGGKQTGSRVENESRWEQFCRVAYGHQDYPENTHRSYFTPEWLTQLMKDAGCSSVRVVYANDLRFQLEGTK